MFLNKRGNNTSELVQSSDMRLFTW